MTITWLGHSAFLIVTPDGKRVVTDPWLSNPKCPAGLAKPDALKPVDLILLSHGHDDHVGEVVPLARTTGAPVVCGFELGLYLSAKGLRNVSGMGIGGTQDVAGLHVTMTQAVHSSAIAEGNQIVGLGSASGFVIRGAQLPTMYFAGDTGLFGDMRIIGDIYKPGIAFLPIGDHHTMGPDTAAIAARWLGVRQVVPMHWGTFPLLRGTPSELRRHLQGAGIDVLELTPGQAASVRDQPISR